MPFCLGFRGSGFKVEVEVKLSALTFELSALSLPLSALSYELSLPATLNP
jgi:hypothetical protein